MANNLTCLYKWMLEQGVGRRVKANKHCYKLQQIGSCRKLWLPTSWWKIANKRIIIYENRSGVDSNGLSIGYKMSAYKGLAWQLIEQIWFLYQSRSSKGQNGVLHFTYSFNSWDCELLDHQNPIFGHHKLQPMVDSWGFIPLQWMQLTQCSFKIAMVFMKHLYFNLFNIS